MFYCAATQGEIKILISHNGPEEAPNSYSPEIRTPTWCMVPMANPNPHPKQQLDRSIRFCTAHSFETEKDTDIDLKKVKVAHTRLPSVGFRSWSRFLAVSLQVTWFMNPAVDCHYFPPGLQLPPQPLIGLLPILLLGEQHNGCDQFA